MESNFCCLFLCDRKFLSHKSPSGGMRSYKMIPKDSEVLDDIERHTSIAVRERIITQIIYKKRGNSVKNKFFTQKFVLTPKFPGRGKNGGLIWKLWIFVRR